MEKRPKVGIALGAGSARGYAHIGVLKVLKREGIPVDFIAGTSMGSLIGAVYANQIDLDMMEQLAIHLKRGTWLDFTVPKMGFLVGKKVQELVLLLTHRKKIEELSIPLAIVTTDLHTGKSVVFTEGPTDLAVRASISIPGIFEPVPWNGKLLVDGGVVDRIPISTVRKMGADVIIGVDVLAKSKHVPIHNIFDVISQTLLIMEREILHQKLLYADVIIHPEVSDISLSAFTQIDECIRRGEIAAEQMLPQIRERITNWRGETKE